jgi:hypothetical protein
MWSRVGGRLNQNGLFSLTYRSWFCLNMLMAAHVKGKAARNAAVIAVV